MYAVVYIGPNISLEVGVLSRYMLKLGNQNSINTKRVFRYFHGTTYYVI
jgi:hypothetical protein